MELIRIIKKSILCIICALAAVISICIYQVNSSNDAVTYRYYRQIINDYDKIKEDRVGLTASKLTAAYDTYKEEDSEYINKAAELVENKEKYVKSYNSYYDNSADNIKSKNYNRIADSTLFGDTDSYYILNANKQLKDKEKLEKADVAFNNTNTAAIEQLLNNRAIPIIYVIMMTVIIIHFTEESDNGVYVLVRTSRRGRIFLPVIRCFVIIVFNIKFF